MRKEETTELWEGTWAVLSFIIGEFVSTMTVAPMLVEVPLLSRVVMTATFGLLLASSFFLIGFPFVTCGHNIFFKVKRRINDYSNSAQKS